MTATLRIQLLGITLVAVAAAWFWAIAPMTTSLLYIHPSDWTDADIVRHLWHVRLILPEWVGNPPQYDYPRWTQAEVLTRLGAVFLGWLVSATWIIWRHTPGRTVSVPGTTRLLGSVFLHPRVWIFAQILAGLGAEMGDDCPHRERPFALHDAVEAGTRLLLAARRIVVHDVLEAASSTGWVALKRPCAHLVKNLGLVARKGDVNLQPAVIPEETSTKHQKPQAAESESYRQAFVRWRIHAMDGGVRPKFDWPLPSRCTGAIPRS